jgi:hypothetical protein
MSKREENESLLTSFSLPDGRSELTEPSSRCILRSDVGRKPHFKQSRRLVRHLGVAFALVNTTAEDRS